MDDIMRADGPAAVAGALSTEESERLVELEGMIDRSFAAGFEALEEVRDRRLYRAKYSTFEEYCRGRWGVVASRARQLIGALDVIKDLKALPAAAASDPEKSVTMVTLPENERQARPLVALGPDERREAWSRSVAASPDGKPTSKRVEKEARAVKRQRPAPPSRRGTDSEERRKEQALRGTSVLAHTSRDQVLVEWATAEGRLERIDSSTALGNPMTPELMGGDRAAVVAWYRDHWFPFVRDALRLDELGGGKVLACRCHPDPCHGDVILEHLARAGAEVGAETVTIPVTEGPPPVLAAAPTSDPAPAPSWRSKIKTRKRLCDLVLTFLRTTTPHDQVAARFDLTRPEIDAFVAEWNETGGNAILDEWDEKEGVDPAARTVNGNL